MKPDEYDAWYMTPFGAYADRLEKELVFSFLGDVRGVSVLDVGCGTGNYSLELAKKGAKVTDIDSSEKMLSKAKEKAKKEGVKVRFVLGKAEELPFNPKSFDIILSVTACEFLDDMGLAIKEMERVVKDDGKIVVGLINKWSLYCIGKRIIGKFRKDSIYNRARFYDITELKRLFGDVEWDSTLFAQEWFPSWFLKPFHGLEKILSKAFKPFGAFIVLSKGGKG